MDVEGRMGHVVKNDTSLSRSICCLRSKSLLECYSLSALDSSHVRKLVESPDLQCLSPALNGDRSNRVVRSDVVKSVPRVISSVVSFESGLLSAWFQLLLRWDCHSRVKLGLELAVRGS